MQVTVEVRFITVDDDFFESVGVNFNFNVNDNVSGSTLGLGKFGSPVFSGGTTSTSSTSGTTPDVSKAHIGPVRPTPVRISSKMSKAPVRSHRSRRPSFS